MTIENEKELQDQLAIKLREARKRVKLTQKEAAQIASMDYRSLARIERAERQVKALELRNLAEAYACSVDDLLP